MDNAERRITTGRPAIDITEDDNNVYVAEWVIPKGYTKEYGIERRRIVWEMYEVWKAENPSGKRYNKAVDGDIVVDENSISETAKHAYNDYKNVLAFYCLDKVLSNSTKFKTDPPISNRQKKMVKGGYMQIMIANLPIEPHFRKVKMIVGVTLKKDRTMYSVTALGIE